ncbi:hypothetical protein BGX34_001479 [Mortierella sp. NVP85]|nr:hypothetical protein BGX34_001479 [Mortierella sp. NVP85]
MSIVSSITESPLFLNLVSYFLWFLILGTPLVIFFTVIYCAAKGTGNVAGFIIDRTTKRVRSYQQQQRKRDKIDPPIEA